MAAADKMGPEQVANWFFRLNGCLTIPNFIVHDDSTASERTDVDILAVRFPHRLETAGGEPLRDHKKFGDSKRIDLVIAEIKTGPCRLNGPWTDPDKGNMSRVLSAIGIIRDEALGAAAESLYEKGQYEDDQFRIRLFALGRERNFRILDNAVQITWPEVAEFFFDRFREHDLYKRQHEQWDDTGKRLFELSIISHTREDFAAQLLDAIGVKRRKKGFLPDSR
jgi:hypothetical protein